MAGIGPVEPPPPATAPRTPPPTPRGPAPPTPPASSSVGERFRRACAAPCKPCSPTRPSRTPTPAQPSPPPRRHPPPPPGPPGHLPALRGKRPAGPAPPARRHLPPHRLPAPHPPRDHPSSASPAHGIEYRRHPRAATDSEGRPPKPLTVRTSSPPCRPASRCRTSTSAYGTVRHSSSTATSSAAPAPAISPPHRTPPADRTKGAWAAPRTGNGSHTEVTISYLCRNRAMRSASHRSPKRPASASPTAHSRP